MKNFIYLVQGKSELVAKYTDLENRENADAIFLTYDEQIENAIYFPDSSWSEGRNLLLKKAREKGNYLYYIFCDDDIEFVIGGWDQFEDNLLRHKPAIGYPVFHKTRHTKISFLDLQVFDISDQQLIAFHKDLINDGFILPYQQQLDQFHWWSSGVIVHLIIENFYRIYSIQFNNIQILNTHHGRYDMTNRSKSIKFGLDWFGKDCKNGFNNFERKNKHNNAEKIKVLLLTMVYRFRRNTRDPEYKINKNKLVKFFKDDSVLLNQYNDFHK